MMVVALAGGCTGEPAPVAVRSSAPPSVSTEVPGPPPEPAAELRGRDLVGRTGVRLLVEGVWYDIDDGTRKTTPFTSWLQPVAGSTILVAEPGSSGKRSGPVRVRRIDAGIPVTLRVDGSGWNYRLAPSVDGRGLWISEYRSQTACTLREQDVDGRTRRPARPFRCGVEPIMETPHGLWVSRWVNVYTLNGRNVESTEPTYALLDPGTLREKASYEEAFVIGAHHVLTMDDQENGLVLRDLRTGTSVPLTKPAPYNSFFVFNSGFPIARVSPDGRYALIRLGSHYTHPQVIDLWLLDLDTGGWQHVPGTPVEGALKFASEAWAPDGRVIMLGLYGPDRAVLATWRPGEPQVAVRPDTLPKSLYDHGLGPLLVAGSGP
jgi:hypothetical protein